MWIDDHILVDSSCDAPANESGHRMAMPGGCGEWDVPDPVSHGSRTFAGRDNVTHRIDQGLHFRLEWLHYGGGPASLQVLWRQGTPSLTADSSATSAAAAFAIVPASALTPVVSGAEQWRQGLQSQLSRGWNTWMRDNAMRHLHLPSGFGVELSIWDAASGKQVDEGGLVDKCVGADANSCKIIAGHHSYNGSATSFVLRTEWTKGVPTTNVTIASGHVDGSAGNEFVLTVEPSRANTSLWAVFTPGFFFDCAQYKSSDRHAPILPGKWLPACGGVHESRAGSGYLVSASPAGQGKGLLTISCGGGPCDEAPKGLVLPPHSIAVALGQGAVSLSGVGPVPTSPPEPKPVWRSTEEAKQIVAQRISEVVASLDAAYPREEVGQMRDGAEAMRTVIGWNTVWDQRVKVLTPVSRTFGVSPWIMWDWDTYFLSIMAAEADELLGYSNIITVTRGRTIRGQVPNAECAQWTNDDRSEPYVGAQVVLQHFRKFGEVRLVELLYDDLLTWNNWVLAKRTLQPAGLVSVGSDVVNTAPHDGHTKQAAIWETGMDNSPMYDEVTWDAAVDKMLIYDVGMTSEFVGEAAALAELARILNKTDDAAMLESRRARMAAKVQRHLWDEERQIYLNLQQDTGAFNTHTSPTSFYPMLSGTATTQQALAMTRRWLTNHSGYCLGNSSGPPPPPPQRRTEKSLSTWFSEKRGDNAVCLRGGSECKVIDQLPDTATADAKHNSAAHIGDCCPGPMHVPNGFSPPLMDTSFRFVRTESYELPTTAELAAAVGAKAVELKFFYSKANDDNFVGTNASAAAGYEEVRGLSMDGQANVSMIAATIFATPPNSSFVPMELWWSEGRRDYQNVASKASRYLLCTDAAKCHDPYVLVQRLGFVMIGDSGWRPGDDNHTTMGPCRYALPSTPNDDLAYRDNSYWRGRVWGPLNYLVHMGLSHPKYAHEPEIAAARKQLAVQSRQALMVEWLPKHHVHENLNPDDGLGDDVGNSNPMYHWGALLAFIEIVESGRFYG